MKSNSESLRVYQFSEEIADRVWDLVMEWDFFARDTVGKQLVDELGPKLNNFLKSIVRGRQESPAAN